MGRGIVVALALGVVLTGCGDASSDAEDPRTPAASPTGMLPADGPVHTVTTVLDDGDGPVMCLAGYAWTSPPECDGPAVAGWSWTDHPDHESDGGVRWGQFDLVGTWDGTALTPTEVGQPPEVGPGPIGGDPFITSCDEPASGWAVLDSATTTDSARNDASRVAESLPDYGLVWVDQSINPRWEAAQDLDGGEDSLKIEKAMNDPTYMILNVGVTDDLDRAEAAVREVWGGALCVHRLQNTFARLRQVAEELGDVPGNLGPQFGTISNRVDLPVVHDDGSIQAWADEEYGTDVVEVTSALEPVR